VGRENSATRRNRQRRKETEKKRETLVGLEMDGTTRDDE